MHQTAARRFASKYIGFLGRWIRCQSPFLAAVGDVCRSARDAWVSEPTSDKLRAFKQVVGFHHLGAQPWLQGRRLISECRPDAVLTLGRETRDPACCWAAFN